MDARLNDLITEFRTDEVRFIDGRDDLDGLIGNLYFVYQCPLTHFSFGGKIIELDVRFFDGEMWIKYSLSSCLNDGVDAEFGLEVTHAAIAMAMARIDEIRREWAGALGLNSKVTRVAKAKRYFMKQDSCLVE
jgi:hypothetical protein